MVAIMVTTAAAAPNRNYSVDTVSLHLDPNSLLHSRNLRPLQNTSISPWTYE